MNTSQFISNLAKQIGGNTYTRQQLVDIVNAKQNELLGRDIKCMRINPDPCIHTTSGTYRYVASSALYDSIDNTSQFDVRSIAKVYSTTLRNLDQYQYGAILRDSDFPESLQNPFNSNKVIIPANCDQSINPESDDCTITFWRENDPGTHTDNTILCEAYRWPTQVTSDQVDLSIPQQFLRLLKLLVLIDVEEAEVGYASPKLYEERDSQMKLFNGWANKGSTFEKLITRPREL